MMKWKWQVHIISEVPCEFLKNQQVKDMSKWNARPISCAAQV